MAIPVKRAGDLRGRVAFERKASAAADAYGNTEGSFEEQFSVAASVVPKLGGEGVLAARLSGKQPMLITVRYSSSTVQVTTDWRVRDMRTDEIYNIRSIVDVDQRRTWLEMLCEAGVAT